MMEIIQKIKTKQEDLQANPAVTIAFLGDSVTQGCFEDIKTAPDALGTVFEPKYAYSTHLQELLHFLYPSVQINIINSGISGDRSVLGAERVERDILRYQPDLVVVSYGLNDAPKGMEKLPEYKEALAKIFRQVRDAGIECIFLTENMVNTYTDCNMTDTLLIQTAEFLAPFENDGVLAAYFEAAKDVAAQHGVKVCDCYAKWRALAAAGVDTTRLLANKLNHPVREMTWLFAYSLLETMFAN